MDDTDVPGGADLTEEQIWAEMSGGPREVPDDTEAEAPADAPVEAPEHEAAPVAAQETPAPEAPPAEAAPQDLWETVPEALRNEYRTIRHERDSDRGRIAAYQRRIAELEAAQQAAAAQPAAAAAPAPQNSDIDQRLRQVREDYPELAEPLIAVIEQVRREAEQLGQRQQQQLQRYYADQQRRLSAAHPDWSTVFTQNAAELAAWLPTQPDEFRAALERNAQAIEDAEEAAAVVAAFKAHLQQKQAPAPAVRPQPQAVTPPRDARRERQILGATAVAPAGRQAVSATLPEDADEEAIWAELVRRDRSRTG